MNHIGVGIILFMFCLAVWFAWNELERQKIEGGKNGNGKL